MIELPQKDTEAESEFERIFEAWLEKKSVGE